MEFQVQSKVSGAEYPLLSYAVAGQDNEIRVEALAANQLRLTIGGTNAFATNFDTSVLADGNVHSVGVSWDNTNGDWAVYLNGERQDSGTGLSVGHTIGTGGTLVLGHEQDIVGGGFSAVERFQGTFHDVRIWNEVRSEAEIALNHQHKFDSGSLPSGLIANWQMDGFNGSNQVVDVVSGNNLSVGHATGAGFTSSTPTEDLHISENAVAGESVGFVVPTDPDVSNDIVSDGLFTEAPDPGSFIRYSAGQAIGDWTVRFNEVDHFGTFAESSPMGGHTIDLNGSLLGEGGIYQTLNTEVGRQYQVVFELSGNFGDGILTKELRVSAAGQIQDFVVTRPDGWNRATNMLYSGRSMTFTADDTTTDLDFASLTPGTFGGPVIGDIRVIEIPAAVTTILNNDPTLDYDAATGKFYRAVNSPVSFATAQAAGSPADSMVFQVSC